MYCPHFLFVIGEMLVSYVWTARSVSNVKVLPLLTWNTYNFMLNLPEFFALAFLAHLVLQGHPVKKHKQTHEPLDNFTFTFHQNDSSCYQEVCDTATQHIKAIKSLESQPCMVFSQPQHWL